jgi:hypothetical protein
MRCQCYGSGREVAPLHQTPGSIRVRSDKDVCKTRMLARSFQPPAWGVCATCMLSLAKVDLESHPSRVQWRSIAKRLRTRADALHPGNIPEKQAPYPATLCALDAFKSCALSRSLALFTSTPFRRLSKHNSSRSEASRE